MATILCLAAVASALSPQTRSLSLFDEQGVMAVENNDEQLLQLDSIATNALNESDQQFFTKIEGELMIAHQMPKKKSLTELRKKFAHSLV